MDNDELQDIVKARELFRKYRRTPDHKLRISYFDQGMELLAPYIEDNSDKGPLARNIQKAQTRELLNELPLSHKPPAKPEA